MASNYWGPADSVWSDDNLVTGNWYDSAAFVTRVAKPTNADAVYFVAGSGDCTLDEDADCLGLVMPDYTGVLDFAGYTLSGSSVLNMSGGTIIDGRLYWSLTDSKTVYGSASLLTAITFRNAASAATYTATLVAGYSLNTKLLQLESPAGPIQLLAQSDASALTVTEQFIAVETAAVILNNGSNAIWLFNGLFDYNGITTIYGPLTFGGTADTDVTLHDTNTYDYKSMVCTGTGASRVTVAFINNPTKYSYLNLDTMLLSGNVEVDFDNADIRIGNYGIETTLNTIAIGVYKPRWETGAGNDFQFKGLVSLSNIEYIGDHGAVSSSFRFSYGTPAAVYIVPPTDNTIVLDINMVVWGVGPAKIVYIGVPASTDPLKISGTLEIVGLVATCQVEVHPPGSEFGDVLVRCPLTAGEAELHLVGATTINGSLTLDGFAVASGKASVYFYAADHAIHGDFVTDNLAHVDQSGAGGFIRCYAGTGDGRLCSLGLDTTVSLLGTTEFRSEAGAGVADFEWHINNAVNKTVQNLSFIAGAAPLNVKLTAAARSFLISNQLTFKGNGNACGVLESQNLVRMRSATPASQSTMQLMNPVLVASCAFTKFTDFGMAGPAKTIEAFDGTCIDGSGNIVNIDFTTVDDSWYPCPQNADFEVDTGGSLPDAQVLTISRLTGSGPLTTATRLTGLPAWLTDSITGSGDDQEITLRPTTTALAIGIYTVTLNYEVVGTIVEIRPVYVTYTVLPVPVIELTPDNLAFAYQRPAGVLPGSQTVDVTNQYEGEVDPLDTVQVTGVPSWLTITVGGVGDAQTIEAAISAPGLLLPFGVYTVQLTVSAANAGPVQLTVVYTVQVTLLVIEPAELAFQLEYGELLPEEQFFQVSNGGNFGVLDGAVYTPNQTWLSVIGRESGNAQLGEVHILAEAQTFAVGVYVAQIAVSVANAEGSPQYVAVTLTVLPPPARFALSPPSIEFTPDQDWTVPPAQQVNVDTTGHGAFASPVVVTNVPDWLQVTVDDSDPDHQILTLIPILIPIDPDDYSAILLVTGDTVAALLVSMTLPAFFRRPGCQMDFVPAIAGTIVEECDVPPAPLPIPSKPELLPPPVPAPTYPMSISMSGPPCIVCTATIEYEDQDEVGYGKPRVIIECEDHGCDGDNLPAGIYGDEQGSGDIKEDNKIVTAIEIDECGHICGIWFEDDDTTSV